jgi:hypothetical protein
MHERHTSILSIVALLCFAPTATAAYPQTKPAAFTPPKKAVPVVAKAIPPIKCTDPDSMVACKSFKQLVDAKDKDLLDSIQGTTSKQGRHYAYVCPRAKSDVFKIVFFDEPGMNGYHPHPTDGFLLGSFALDGDKIHPSASLSTKDKWFNDHADYLEYGFNSVMYESYEDGIVVDFESDFGRWSRTIASKNESQENQDASFEGGYFWLSKYNKEHDNELKNDDYPEHAHIWVGNSGIDMQYAYENRNNGTTDYTLTIQRSTGRFTETFKPSVGESFSYSGTCMIFK